MDTPKTPFELACDIVGSQAEMARILQVTPAMVNQLVKGHRPVPIEHCLAVERATGGKVTRQELRPNDAYRIWPDPDQATNPITDHILAAAAQAGLIERRSVIRRAEDRAMRKALKDGNGATHG